MRKVIGIILCFYFSALALALAQKDTVGLFYCSEPLTNFRIILYSDNTYKILRPSECFTPTTSDIGTYNITADTIVEFNNNSKLFYGKLVNEQLSFKKGDPDTVYYYKYKFILVGKAISYYNDLITLKYFYSNNRIKADGEVKYRHGEYYKTKCTQYYESGAITGMNPRASPESKFRSKERGIKPSDAPSVVGIVPCPPPAGQVQRQAGTNSTKAESLTNKI